MNIVVTGASRGIGKAITERFAADGEGHQFYLCARNSDALEKFTSGLTNNHPGIQVFMKAVDFASREELTGFGEWLLTEAGSIDVLVNNAGVFIPGNIHDEPEGALESIMEVNLLAPYHLTRMLLPAMIRQKRGHIFNISSIAALQAYPGGGAYSISKFALDGFSKNLRHEMKPHGIKVTSVHPGATYTDSWASSGIAEDRFMTAADVAAMIYAASQLSSSACVEDIIIRPQPGDL